MMPTPDVLDAFYRKRGIHSMDFQCRCRSACASTTTRPFTEAKSAFVGSHYDDGKCRLLFLGLDPGEGEQSWPAKEQRTPEAIRKKIEGDAPRAGDVHWWGTLRFAARILSSFDSEICKLYELGPEDCRSWRADFLNPNREKFRTIVTPSFAHANAVRCSVNAKSRRKANKILYANCRKYLCGEIEALRPDVIVTQGEEAREGLVPYISGVGGRSKCRGGCNPTCGERCRIGFLGEREILWIHTHHPTRCPRRGESKRPFEAEGGTSWSCYAAAVEAFMKAKHPSLTFTSYALARHPVEETQRS